MKKIYFKKDKKLDEIIVKYFGAYRYKFRKEKENMYFYGDVTVKEVVEKVSAKYKTPIFGYSLILQNGTPLNIEDRINNLVKKGDEISIFSQISGG